MPYKRTCPSCGTAIIYANLAGFRRAAAAKSICRRCAARPAVIQGRLAEAEEKKAELGGEKMFSAFFSRVEAGLSGSAGRER
jgi:ribosomal protein S27AE